eukprot:XP_011682216.1 PREDICTED: uncharacterized protein LOC755086 [Strongylocentrotus purpuratus]
MAEVRLKKITDSIGLMQKNLECSICLDLLQDPVSTKCDHQFCNFCVLALLQSSSKPSARCPLCKIVITKRSLTKNEQLDGIVKAVRSVITAVEEDSGLRCSPPRGPVLFSQPDPKPREPTPQKKAKGQISSKVKGQGRTGNLRKTKRKAAETVSVYRDDSESSDSDAFELPLVGHTNISSSFPRLKTDGKKGYHDDDQENEELEKEAEDLLAALNAAPLTSRRDIISGYSNELNRLNNEINLLPINSGHPEEKGSRILDSQPNISQNLTTPADSEIFAVPAPRVLGQVNNPKEGDQDPYEFVPSQRTPRKVKKKAGRKKNQNGKKEFPIRNGRFTKLGAPKRDHRSASSCSESDQESAINQSKTVDEGVKLIAKANSKGQNATRTSSHLKNGGKESHTHLAKEDETPTAIIEDVDLMDSTEVVMDDTVARLDNEGGNCLKTNGNAQEKAPHVDRNLIKHPLPITPVVVIRRPRGAGGNIQGSQQSSEGGMMIDSQPVVINKNHGRRVFATTYGKVKNGVDKSPPLDPQDRILDWLVSKNAGSDESDDDGEEGKEKEGAENSEELPDILVTQGTDQGSDDLNYESLPLEEGKCTPEVLPKVTTIVDQSEPVEESKSKEDQINQMKLTPQKRDKTVLESRNGRRHSGRLNKESREEKRTLDHVGGKEDIHDIEDSTMNTSTKNVDKESPPRRRTVKQRMEENFKEQAKAAKKESAAARKESKAATIKSDWELALELARQFGTEPEHLKGEPTETGGRSSRRRKGKLTIEKVPESIPVRKSKGHVQENQQKESNETIDIDSFETQNLKRVPVKTTVKERTSTGADKRKALASDKRKASPGIQRNIHAKDQNGEVLQNDTPEARVLTIPETPFILDQPKGKKSLEGELSPKTGIVEVECQEQNLESSRPGKVEDTKSSMNQQPADDCTPESKSSQRLTPSLRRSKRGSHPGPPNSNNNVPEEVLSGRVDKKKKAKVSEEVQQNETDPERTRGVVRVLRGAGDVANEAEFSLPAIERAEREAGENVEVEVPTQASLPLYTEDIPKVDNDEVSPKKCRGSDTTESIDLEIDSDEYEDPDGALEKEFEPSTGGSSAKKDVNSPPKKQQKPPFDDEMSIMECILPSMSSQQHPDLGISPGPGGNSSGTASDQVQTEEEVCLSKKPDEVLTVLSGSSSSAQQASQASVTIISQTKTSGSFPVSLDLNSQPSESLLLPLKQSKRKASEDGRQGSNLHTPDGDIVKEPTMQTSPGAIQQVDGLKEACGGSDLQGVQTSSGSGNSRPTRRISRRKRKTFTIDASPSAPASKEKATLPSQNIQIIPDSLEQPTASSNKSNLTKEANQYQKDPEAPSHKETCEADEDIDFVENMKSPSCQRSVRKGSKSPQDSKTLEVADETLTSQQTASPMTRKKSKSLPLSDSQSNRKSAVKNIEDSEKESPSCAYTSQETVVSVASKSSLTLKRKSRSGGRLTTQSPIRGSDVEEPVVQPSPSNPDGDFDGNCNEASSLRDGRRSSSRRNKIYTKYEGLVSDGSAIPTTQGASEMNERLSDVIISARAFQLQSKKTLPEGPENPQRTPGSSPRQLRRSARQSRDMIQPRNESAMSNTEKEEQEIEQRIITPPQECITVVDESIGMSLAEKEASQECNRSLDTCNFDEESRDMFDEEETAGNQGAKGIEESQSMNAEILLLSKDLNAKDTCSSSDLDNSEKPSGNASQFQQVMQKETPRSTRKSQNLNVPDEIDETKDAMMSQGSCQYEETEALIPPTPPCHDMSKSRMSSFLHTSGLSKAIPKKKKAQEELEPDMSSLLCPSEDTTKEQDFVRSKSLVMETPTVVSRKRNKVPRSQTEDKSIADTPVKRKRGSVDRREKSARDQNVVTVQGGDQEVASEHPELSPREPSVCDLRLNGPRSKTCRKVTSQIIGDTQSEPPIKSSNESDEIPKTTIRRRKQVITDDVSDDDDDEEEEEEEGFIGRQKRRKSRRMVQVARDEEDESDDELIPCSFLQTSVQKPVEKEEDDDEDNPMVLFGDHTGPHLSHGAYGGSVSSEDSCASHHMNLTSASSIPSSQSEIMNTQQQEKTREDMEALEEQMAELHAALARERGSRSHDDTNDEDEEKVEENPQGFIVEETEGASTPASKKQNNSARSRQSSPGRTKRRSKALETSDEEDEMDDEKDMIEPRSPSPPPPLSPSTVRKASSSLSMSDSIRSVTSMVEQYRKSSSKKVTTKKRRIEDDPKDASGNDDRSDDDDVAMVSCKSSRNSSSPRAEASRTSSKKRKMDSVDSDVDFIQDRVNSPAKSRSNSVGRTVEERKTVHSITPPSRTTPTLSSSRASASGRSLSKTPQGRSHSVPGIATPLGHQTPKFRTLQDRLTPGRTPGAFSVPSPLDVSMKTQRSPAAHSERRSGDQSLRTPEARPCPSSRPSSRPMSLIATGLNRLELRQVEQLTSQLANCRFASAFNANTTHVIVKTDSSLVCERTLKYFQGIAARAWIVSFQWVHDSLKARKILAEEDYEVRGDVVNGEDHHGPKRARTVEGPGFMAKFDLCCIGPFTGLNKDQLVGLCEMCGASTVQHPSLFPYNPGRKAFIVVEPNLDTDRNYQGLQRKFRVPVISREWVLDSIALYKSQPITDYLLTDFTSPMTDQPTIDLDSDDDQ